MIFYTELLFGHVIMPDLAYMICSLAFSCLYTGSGNPDLNFRQKFFFFHRITVINFIQLKRFARYGKAASIYVIHHLFEADRVIVIISSIIVGKVVSRGKLTVITGSFLVQNKEYGLVDIGDAVHQIF